MKPGVRNEAKTGRGAADRPVLFTDYEVRKKQRAGEQAAVATVDKAKAGALGTIYHQMLVPTAIREILPTGIIGALCALMIFLMVSTDTTYMHSWGSIIVQDIILPFRKTPFTPKQQLNLLRWLIAGVAVFAFLFSFFFAQMDYILMFMQIAGAIWVGGAGPVIVFGLYWKRGTTAGAFSALIAGSSLAFGGIIWNAIYPWPAHWWAIKFHITALIIPCIVAVITTIWFSIGGTVDLHRLFKALAAAGSFPVWTVCTGLLYLRGMPQEWAPARNLNLC